MIRPLSASEAPASPRGALSKSLRLPGTGGLTSGFDLGEGYDPIRSLADLLTRYLYARRYQQEAFDPQEQPAEQSRNAAYTFELKRALRKLRLGAIPIRVVFVAQDPLDWLSLDSLYDACVSDPRFKTHVVNIGFTYGNYATDCSTLFHQRGIEYLDGMRDRFPFDRLNPDLLVLSSPYDHCRPAWYSAAELLRYARIAYICYGPDFADGAGKMAPQIYGHLTHRKAWRIFSRSRRTLGQYARYGDIPRRRIPCLGHPRIDQYYSHSALDALPEALLRASAGRFKIIYAPHHTLAGWSTFLRYADHIRRLLAANEDCYLVFRPHPLLKQNIEEADEMSRQEFESYFSGDRGCIYEGDDYYSLFRWSDLLISDASSFLIEYAPTRKPIVYLHREDGWDLDETLKEDVWQSCYVARSEQEITDLVRQLKRGSDPLAGVRERSQENMSTGVFEGGAGRRIAAYLKRRLA